MSDNNESKLILEALKCLRYDLQKTHKIVLRTESTKSGDVQELVDKMLEVDKLMEKWRNIDE
tara:strand:- start:175 stop:360 length:186 start_codon:yes stop_codon:yes gene_type:complete